VQVGKNADVYKLLGFSPEKDTKSMLSYNKIRHFIKNKIYNYCTLKLKLKLLVNPSKFVVTSGPSLLFHGDTNEALSQVVLSFTSALSSKVLLSLSSHFSLYSSSLLSSPPLPSLLILL
jgi:hypothetical protein